MEKFEFDPSELDAKIAEAYKDDREQTRLFKHRRANQVLTEGEVRAIKMGRKKLRMELKARGITKKKDWRASIIREFEDMKFCLNLSENMCRRKRSCIANF